MKSGSPRRAQEKAKDPVDAEFEKHRRKAKLLLGSALAATLVPSLVPVLLWYFSPVQPSLATLLLSVAVITVFSELGVALGVALFVYEITEAYSYRLFMRLASVMRQAGYAQPAPDARKTAPAEPALAPLLSSPAQPAYNPPPRQQLQSQRLVGGTPAAAPAGTSPLRVVAPARSSRQEALQPQRMAIAPPEEEAPLAPVQAVAAPVKLCPHCGRELPFGDLHIICPFCGSPLK